MALDADEEDEEGGHAEESAIGFLIHPEKAKTPVQLSNVLMKALKMGGDEKAESVSPQTKNQDKRKFTLVTTHVHVQYLYMYMYMYQYIIFVCTCA